MERVPTGISGLDELIEGGLPKGRCTLVCGGPGSGKTIFSTQFLVEGARKYDEPGVFVTFDEDPVHIRENMLRFGWNLEDLEKQGKLSLIDFSPVIYLSPQEFKKTVYGVEMPEFSIESATEMIKTQVDGLKAERVVVDPITSLIIQVPEVSKRRRNIAHLFKALLETGCTCIVTSESRAALLEREPQVEEYLAQGVILLQTIRKGDQLVKAIQIEKMRGVAHDTQPHPYYITNEGIKVFPKEKVL
ncbi:MAG: RAD55 family ATPase [Candidatus Geothermarchaeales archaeon]